MCEAVPDTNEVGKEAEVNWTMTKRNNRMRVEPDLSEYALLIGLLAVALGVAGPAVAGVITNVFTALATGRP